MQLTNAYLYRLAGESMALGYRASPGWEARLTTSASLVLSGEPVADLNYALISSGPSPEKYLHEFVEVARARRIPIMFLFASAIASKIEPEAKELGLECAGPFPFMVYHPHEFSPKDNIYRIESVKEQNGLREANSVMASAFDIPCEMVDRAFSPTVLESPGVEFFIAMQYGETISTVQTTRHGPYVGIWSMATPPAHQRKGAGLALLEHVITYHLKNGAKLFYLGATPAGRPLYRKIGFETVDEAQVWIFTP